MRGYCLRLCRLLVFNIKSSQLEVLLEQSFLKELQKFIENTCIRFLVYSFLNFCQEKRTPSQFFFSWILRHFWQQFFIETWLYSVSQWILKNVSRFSFLSVFVFRVYVNWVLLLSAGLFLSKQHARQLETVVRDWFLKDCSGKFGGAGSIADNFLQFFWNFS